MKLAGWIGLVIVLLNSVAIGLTGKLGLGLRPLSIGLVATACLGFVGLLALTQSKEPWTITEGVMRTAIAGTFVLVYLTLLGIVAFFRPQLSLDQVDPTLAQASWNITETLVTNFTTLMGAIMAFYFGSSAYAQTRTSSQDAKPLAPSI